MAKPRRCCLAGLGVVVIGRPVVVQMVSLWLFSVMAVRALVSSTMGLSLTRAARSAARQRLFTARGLPRLFVWMRLTASSLKRVSARPTRDR